MKDVANELQRLTEKLNDLQKNPEEIKKYSPLKMPENSYNSRENRTKRPVKSSRVEACNDNGPHKEPITQKMSQPRNLDEKFYTKKELIAKRGVNALLLMRLVDSGILRELSGERFLESDILRCIQTLKGFIPLRTLMADVFTENASGLENQLVKLSDFEHEMYRRMKKEKKLPNFIYDLSSTDNPFYVTKEGCEKEVNKLFESYGIKKYLSS